MERNALKPERSTPEPFGAQGLGVRVQGFRGLGCRFYRTLNCKRRSKMPDTSREPYLLVKDMDEILIPYATLVPPVIVCKTIREAVTVPSSSYTKPYTTPTICSSSIVRESKSAFVKSGLNTVHIP